jgi:hypothetical protein
VFPLSSPSQLIRVHPIKSLAPNKPGTHVNSVAAGHPGSPERAAITGDLALNQARTGVRPGAC